MSDPKRPPANRTSALLGDLESIRTLLEQPGAVEPVGDDDDVPLLEDVVHGGVSVNETFLSGEADFEETGPESHLDEDLFKALLSERWRDSARELLDQTRAAVGQHRESWTPAHTDELNSALKARIDDALQRWLHELVHSRVHELHALLLDVIHTEIDRIARDLLDTPATDEDRNGV
jgi:hypothetical protein